MRIVLHRVGHLAALPQRFDQGPLDGAGVLDARLGVLKRLEKDPGATLVQLGVVVAGSRRIRDTPPGHRALGVQPCGFTERALGLVVVERLQPDHALVEVPLGLVGGGRELAVVVPEPLEELGALGRIRVRLVRDQRNGGDQTADDEADGPFESILHEHPLDRVGMVSNGGEDRFARSRLDFVACRTMLHEAKGVGRRWSSRRSSSWWWLS